MKECHGSLCFSIIPYAEDPEVHIQLYRTLDIYRAGNTK